jgi:hypothetical protein
MCFLLYAGTTKPLPRRQWQKDAPALSVVTLTVRDVPIKAHFSKPEVQYIGSTSGCGCDFPNLYLQNGEWPRFEVENDAESDARDRYNRESLVALLRKSGEKAVELYGVWDRDFAKMPQGREDLSLRRILDSDFLFKDQCFYLVRDLA